MFYLYHCCISVYLYGILFLLIIMLFALFVLIFSLLNSLLLSLFFFRFLYFFPSLFPPFISFSFASFLIFSLVTPLNELFLLHLYQPFLLFMPLVPSHSFLLYLCSCSLFLFSNSFFSPFPYFLHFLSLPSLLFSPHILFFLPILTPLQCTSPPVYSLPLSITPHPP